MSPAVNCGLWMTMMCQPRLINKWTTLLGVLVMGEAVLAWGQRAKKPLFLSVHFAVNLKCSEK